MSNFFDILNIQVVKKNEVTINGVCVPCICFLYDQYAFIDIGSFSVETWNHIECVLNLRNVAGWKPQCEFSDTQIEIVEYNGEYHINERGMKKIPSEWFTLLVNRERKFDVNKLL